MAATAFVVVMATACGEAATPMDIAGAFAAGDQDLIKEGFGPLFLLPLPLSASIIIFPLAFGRDLVCSVRA
jgi:hypothetical protein